jgi:hypothetical protein
MDTRLTVAQLIELLQQCQPTDLIKIFDSNEDYAPLFIGFVERHQTEKVVYLHEKNPDFSKGINGAMLTVVNQSENFVETIWK